MTFANRRFAVSALVGLAGLGVYVSAGAAAPDAGFFTSYRVGLFSNLVSYETCGASLVGSGCYGGGTLEPFGRVGCMIEGDASIKGNAVTRAVYIVDVSSGNSGTGVTLYRYLKTDTIAAGTGDDTVTVTLTNTIPIPLVGGASAVCFLAGNHDSLYIGSDQNPQVVRVKKGAFSVTSLFNINNIRAKIKRITANEYGFVSVVLLDINSGLDVPLVYTPSGVSSESGSGDAVLLTPSNGVSNIPGP